MWVARDKSGALRLYIDKPLQKQTIKGTEYESWDWCTDMDKMVGYLPSDMFPNLKYGDEPVEVLLFTKEFIQSFGDACYEQGEKDACHFEYGEPEEGNLLIDEYITKNTCG